MLRHAHQKFKLFYLAEGRTELAEKDLFFLMKSNCYSIEHKQRLPALQNISCVLFFHWKGSDSSQAFCSMNWNFSEEINHLYRIVAKQCACWSFLESPGQERGDTDIELSPGPERQNVLYSSKLIFWWEQKGNYFPNTQKIRSEHRHPENNAVSRCPDWCKFHEIKISLKLFLTEVQGVINNQEEIKIFPFLIFIWPVFLKNMEYYLLLIYEIILKAYENIKVCLTPSLCKSDLPFQFF